jgi:hypothetical protein
VHYTSLDGSLERGCVVGNEVIVMLLLFDQLRTSLQKLPTGIEVWTTTLLTSGFGLQAIGPLVGLSITDQPT